MWRFSWVIVLALLAVAGRADERRVFFFGNSLIHHLTDSDETAVPHWLALMADAGGLGFAADGVWGFPLDFVRNLPPEPNWSFGAVPSALDGRTFRMAGLTDIITNPANFIQGDPPDAPVQEGSAVDLTTRLFDWADGQAPQARLWIYEGWGRMGDVGFPPSSQGLRRWHAANTGDGHNWYRSYAAQVSAQLGAEVRLIPVASVLSALMQSEPWSGIPVTDLFSDDAPHGTATQMLLAAMVTHVVLWGQVPAAPVMSDAVHPVLRDNFDAAAAQIFGLVTGAAIPAGAVLAPPETGLDNPSGAMGLVGIADWSTQLPFLDQMKSARPWVAHTELQWGAYPFETLLAQGHLSDQGWPVSLPDDATAIETFILTDLPPQAQGVAGRYVLRWQGGAEVSVGGRATDIVTGAGEIRFAMTPGDGPVAIRLTGLDPADPITGLTVVRDDRLDLWEGGAVFNPDWLVHVRDLRMVRFMDWMDTNGSELVAWDDRPRPMDFSWQWRGVPVEVMVQLANEIGADPWFTLPHLADDAHVAAFAGYVNTHLDPRLQVFAEWSNEVWNWQFPQTHWAGGQAVARWGAGVEGTDAWMQFAGHRAAQVADIWAGIFADDAGRLVRVVSTQTSWPGLEIPLLDAPLRVAEGLPPPENSFDAYAVAGYFGGDVGYDPVIARVRDALAGGGVEQAQALVLDHVADVSLPAALNNDLPYQAQVARDRGLRLVMYEGGSHIVGGPDVTDDQAMTDLLIGLHLTPQMGMMYADLITGWHDLGGEAFNAFVDLGPPSRWGSWGHARWLGDATPRSATVAAFNSLPPSWDDARAPGTFLHGVIRQGTDGPDRLDGTPEEDDLLGRGGDDVILAGPGDRVHGGAGQDRVQLPGLAGDWVLSPGRATSPAGEVRLTAVEFVSFGTDPGVRPVP